MNVAPLARGPRYPREHYRLVRLALDRPRKGRQLALGHVIALALGDVQRAVLPEYQGSLCHMLPVDFPIGRRHGATNPSM